MAIVEGKPRQKTSWSFLRRQNWGFVHPVGAPTPMAVQETLPEGGLGRFGGDCAASCPSIMTGFLHQLHQGWSWRCWRWWGAVPAYFWGASRPYRGFKASFATFFLPFPAQEAEEILARTPRAAPWHRWSSALPRTPAGPGKGDHGSNQLAPPRTSLQNYN